MNRQRPPFIVPKTVVIGGANTKNINLPVSSSYRKPPFENQHHSSPYHTLLAYKHIYSDSDKDSLKRHTQQRSYSDYNQDLSPAYNQRTLSSNPEVAGNNRFIVNRKRGQYDRRYKTVFYQPFRVKGDKAVASAEIDSVTGQFDAAFHAEFINWDLASTHIIGKLARFRIVGRNTVTGTDPKFPSSPGIIELILSSLSPSRPSTTP